VGYSTSSSGYKWEGNYVSPDIFLEVGNKFFLGEHFYFEGFTGYDLVFPGTWSWKKNGVSVSSYPGYSNSYDVGGFRLGVNLGLLL
jgi:hypothetical protein